MDRGPYKRRHRFNIKTIGKMFAWKFMLLLLTLVCSYKASSDTSNCLWHKNSCVEKCPEHLVQNVCDCTQNYWLAQRTCTSPQSTLVGTVCGFSRCDCPDGLVLDTDTGYCYDIDNCPTKHIE
ncbi:jg16004 [Pararge aegeria aegeria]|uniref:Jg16004 protein n=1 Tax=Pararge aegeria aegeria TaxID=348720 RepID=A0A8S4SHK1_9NEOP|nr:jg16004 [Pararge aegeria aegeria]